MSDDIVLQPRSWRASMGLVAFAASALARRRGRALALGVSLALTVAAFAGVLFLTDALRGAAERVRDYSPDLVVQRLVAGRPALIDESVAAGVRKIDAVRDVRARVWGYLFVPAVQANVVVVAAHDAGAVSLAALGANMAHGRAPSAPGEAAVGAALAGALGLGVGDELRLPGLSAQPPPALKVVGVFGAVAEVYASDLVLTDESSARALLAVPAGQATDLAIDLTNPAEARVVGRIMTSRIEGARIVDRAQMARVHELAFGRRSGLAFAAVLPALLALLVLGWDRLGSLGESERREIGVLKAVGFSTRDVVFVRLTESLVLGTCATALGIAMAYVWIFVFGAPGLRDAIGGFGVLQGQTPLVPAVDAAQLFGLALGIVAPFVALSVLPAWRAATEDPMDQMR